MSVKLLSWNVNGIRAISKKDEFWDWLMYTDADIINFQEVRATENDIPRKIYNIDGYKSYFNEAEKKGYSGVATYSKIEPLSVTKKLGIESIDNEGRILEIEYPQFTLFNIYFPNSGTNAKRLDYKIEFCNTLLDELKKLKDENKNLVITGDYNIAHKDIDVYNPKNCEGKSGFLPEEKAWLDELEKEGFTDTFRMFNKEENNFTWWSYRTRARERNAGWRLDYFYVNDEIKDKIIKAEILSEVYGSDHCPVTVEIDL